MIESVKTVSEEQKQRLVAAALAAVTKAFLTQEGGVRYGAAVLASNGGIFASGQYSSFNHSTNVHAEQAALIAATMHGQADVLALAVASTGRDAFTRPCGVCRQVMLEHGNRTGRDFLVLMAAANGSFEESSVSGLLPFSWSAASQPVISSAAHRSRSAAPGGGERWEPGDALEFGDQVLLRGGALAMVWDPHPWPGQVAVKLKHRPAPEGSWHKLPHAFSEPMDYARCICGFEGMIPAPCGAPNVCVPCGVITTRFPARPVGLLPPVFGRCLQEAGIPASAVRVTGSRATGMSVEGSDHDLVVRCSVGQAQHLRGLLAQALRSGALTVPPQSGTWRVLDRLFPGGRAAIVEGGRFAETFQEGDVRVALMLCFDGPCRVVHGTEVSPIGHDAVAGEVVCSERAAFKRAEFTLRLAEGGTCRVVSYHKAANLVCTGDFVAARGWMVREGDELLMIQFYRHLDNIVWFPLNSPD